MDGIPQTKLSLTVSLTILRLCLGSRTNHISIPDSVFWILNGESGPSSLNTLQMQTFPQPIIKNLSRLGHKPFNLTKCVLKRKQLTISYHPPPLPWIYLTQWTTEHKTTQGITIKHLTHICSALASGIGLAPSLYTHKKNQMLTELLLAYGIGVSPLLVHSQEKSNAYRTAPCLWDWS